MTTATWRWIEHGRELVIDSPDGGAVRIETERYAPATLEAEAERMIAHHARHGYWPTD